MSGSGSTNVACVKSSISDQAAHKDVAGPEPRSSIRSIFISGQRIRSSRKTANAAKYVAGIRATTYAKRSTSVHAENDRCLPGKRPRYAAVRRSDASRRPRWPNSSMALSTARRNSRGGKRSSITSAIARLGRQRLPEPWNDKNHHGRLKATHCAGSANSSIATTTYCLPLCIYDIGAPVVPPGSSISQRTSPFNLSYARNHGSP